MSSAERAPVTVAVLTGDDRRRTRELLTALAPQLGPYDNVVLLGPRSDPRAPSSWRLPQTKGSLSRPTKVPTPRALVVVLDDRLLLSDRFLETLLAPLRDPSVGAVAPRSNIADGEELLIGLPYLPDDVAQRKAFLRERPGRAGGSFTPARHLGGAALAVRTELLEEAGGLVALQEGHALAEVLVLAHARHATVGISEGAFAHHLGGPTRLPRSPDWPYVSACLIVKDEEAQLEECLASAADVADEIVVYDTGSSDGTVALARRLGAQVILGTWDDDFARARNAALESCRGQWILWLDADERLVCDDRHALRNHLEQMPSGIEGLVVLIDNLQGTEAATAFTHPAVRLFRRANCRWEGALHEQIVRKHDAAGPQLQMLDRARIAHRGYLQSALRERNKAIRNLRSAFEDLVAPSELDIATRLTSLGRSYMMAGLVQEGVDLCERAFELSPRPSTTRICLRALADGYLALQRHEDALQAADRLRRVSRSTLLADVIEGRALLVAGEPDKALACFERIPMAALDDDGFEYRPSLIAAPRADALIALERWGEAADVLLQTLSEEGGLDAHLGLLVEALEAAERDPGEIYDALPRGRVAAFVPQLLQLQPEVADRVLEAWHERNAFDLPSLATAASVAIKLPVDRQLVWSSRLRAAGLPASCPLLASAITHSTPDHDRVLASAVAWTAFGDPRAQVSFVASVLTLSSAERHQLSLELAELAPPLVAVLEGLPAPTATQSPKRSTSANHVVVVSASAYSIHAVGLAVSIAQEGRDVLLLQPATDGAERGLPGVSVHSWRAADATWQHACLHALARIYALEPVDAVILTGTTSDLADEVRMQVPTATVLTEATDRAAIAAQTRLGVAALAGAPRDVPYAARAGVCVLANLHAASPDGDTRVPAVLSTLVDQFPGLVITLCGRDPHGLLQPSAWNTLLPGPQCNPTPWLRAARVALVPAGPDAAIHEELAERCGTPAVRVGGEPAAAARTAATLLGDEEAWRRALADPPTALPTSPRIDLCPHPSPAASNPGPPRPTVRVTGSCAALDSVGQFSRELVRHLTRGGHGIDVLAGAADRLPASSDRADERSTSRLRGDEGAASGAIEIRDQWPPDLRPPLPGERLVCVQTFPFGGLPAEWVGALRDAVDELWVPTRWMRQCAIDSGVPGDRVTVVPCGIDVGRFRPDGPSYPLRTTKRTKFLFVGACTDLSGIDALLEAYLMTFNRDDDVCLVVKAQEADAYDTTSDLERDIRRAAAAAGAEIEMIDDTLDASGLAALYRSCDAFVYPYRGEGFCRSVAQAMACGLPVVTSEGGACDDLCDDEVAWMVPARRVTVPEDRWTHGSLGAWWLEPSRSAIAAALRRFTVERDGGRARGLRGAQRIAERFTWEHAAGIAATRLHALNGTGPKRASLPTLAGAVSA